MFCHILVRLTTCNFGHLGSMQWGAEHSVATIDDVDHIGLAHGFVFSWRDKQCKIWLNSTSVDVVVGSDSKGQ